MLGASENGRSLIGPVDEKVRTTRRYRDGTLILETHVETADGAATVVDFMPLRGEASDVVRLVRGERGRVAFRTELVIRFDYGSLVPWVTRFEDGSLNAIAGPDMVVLRTPVELTPKELTHVGAFDVSAGQTIPFVLTYGPSHLPPPRGIDPLAALEDTETFWRDWSKRCARPDEWAGPVTRSLITLKALTYRRLAGSWRR